MHPAIIEHLIEFGQNMVPMNLGSLLNELDYNFLKGKVINNEWEYIEDTLCGPCTKGFVINSDNGAYRIMFVDYNNIKNRYITPSEVNCYLKRLNEKEKICKKVQNFCFRRGAALRF